MMLLLLNKNYITPHNNIFNVNINYSYPVHTIMNGFRQLELLFIANLIAWLQCVSNNITSNVNNLERYVHFYQLESVTNINN